MINSSRSNIPNFLGFSLFIYIILYIFPFPLDYLPGVDYYILGYYKSLRDQINLWVGIHVLGIVDLEQQINGSGDTTFDYVMVVTYSMVSVLLSMALWLFFRGNLPIEKTWRAVIIYSRYYLGITLISYGLAKFGEGQFPSPRLDSLEQLYGDFSPMGLAWRFFGYSATYKSFMGLAEIIPGLLLLFRRTTVLGALLAVAVTTNIVLVNFSFDVPVKLFSSHLLLFSFLILSPFAADLFRFLVLNQPTQLRISTFPLQNKWGKISRILIKAYLVLLIPLSMGFSRSLSNKFNASANQWEGVYQLEPSLNAADSAISDAYWGKVIVVHKSFVGYNRSNEPDYYQIKEIHEGGKLDIYKYGNEETLYPVEISEQLGTYTIKGNLNKKNYRLTGSRKSKSDYALMSRGFHWINEYPFNR